MLYMWDKKRAPDALHAALGQSVADWVDGIESERAGATMINTAEHVVAQTSKRESHPSKANEYGRLSSWTCRMGRKLT
eukprot:4529323-Prymnesium_polylepis.2